jgi:hypothetical protein
MIYNFAKASANREQITQKLADVQRDAMKLLTGPGGGMTKFNAATSWRGEAANLIREVVVDTFKLTDPTPIFTERRDGKFGDTYEFTKLINTLRVVEYSPQSLPTAFTPRKGVWTIKSASYELPFTIPLQKIMNGQHDLGEFAVMAAEALRRHYVTLVLTAIDTAAASGAVDLKGRPLRTMAAGADVVKAEIDAALRRMNAFNQGVTIFGTRWALDPIYTMIGALSVNLADQLNARGVIGTYRGANIVELSDDFNEYYTAFTSVNGIDLDKLIFIASGLSGAILLERDMSGLDYEVFDPRAAQWSSGIRFDHGVLVHTPFRYHIIQLV